MKKYIPWILVVLLFGTCIFISYDKDKKIAQYKTEIKVLKEEKNNINTLLNFSFDVLYKLKDYKIVDLKMGEGTKIKYAYVYNGKNDDLKKGIRLVGINGLDYTIEMPGDISWEPFDNDSKIRSLSDKYLELALSIKNVKVYLTYEIEIKDNKIAVFNRTSDAMNAWKNLK